ncbi:outer membrane lipoprotein-sorting protein [Granulicella aggregans]|uniref:Outer membrane lipoprotein-sorting protein n=1 Tax=Granulicella aggregans TaxID=474949 RepID=A0A7W7ZKH0_9BACT|nr:outer membrane lipoprotein-sorting protein [Granulicella aggregans]
MDSGYMALIALLLVVVLGLLSTALFNRQRKARRSQIALARLNGALAATQNLSLTFDPYDTSDVPARSTPKRARVTP